MGRTANKQRPEELRRAIVNYLLEHGLADLSLRPLAKAVGSSPRVLLYYFGSKEQLVTNVLADMRRVQVNVFFGEDTAATFAEATTLAWKRLSGPEWEPFFRLFFEAYGIAMRTPRRYRSFLKATIEDWLDLISRPLIESGSTHRDARAFATVVLGGLRGFMLDYCNTGDRKRLDRAVALWARTLDPMLAACRRRST